MNDNEILTTTSAGSKSTAQASRENQSRNAEPFKLNSTEATNPTVLKEDHLQRTVNQKRESMIIEMSVIKISNISPTVKHLVLRTSERPVPISFKAGQW